MDHPNHVRADDRGWRPVRQLDFNSSSYDCTRTPVRAQSEELDVVLKIVVLVAQKQFRRITGVSDKSAHYHYGIRGH